MSDKKFAKDLNDDGNRDEYRAASVMVYDYYPFGQLMPGRSLDTSGLCVTYNNYMEIPSHRYNDGGTLGTGGGGGATSYGAASLANLGSKGVTASGTGGGLVYTITGITDQSIQINTYFSYLSGTNTITAWLGTNTSSTGTQLGSTRTSYISPTSALPISVGGTVASPATVTLVYKMANGSSRTLFSIDSVNYTTLSYTLVTSTFSRCGDPKDKYEFGFNGQMKSNEIAGVGNHNTAKFWEYSTQYARRWNLDPKKKPSLSDYSTFSGNPIWKVDPNGDDDYYNKAGKFIGSDGIGTKIRLMDNDAIQDSKSFITSLLLARKVKMNISKVRDLPGMSRVIKFGNDGALYKKMYRDAKDGAERGTYIVLDAKKAEVRAAGYITGKKGTNETMMFGSGSKLNENTTIISTIHTHQQEEGWMKKGASDKDLFESQYNTKDNFGDGDMAKSSKTNRYSIGLKNVNYYGPKGKSGSSNDAGSRQDLESGKYEIGKESLQNYGKQTKENSVNVLLLIGFFLGGVLGIKCPTSRYRLLLSGLLFIGCLGGCKSDKRERKELKVALNNKIIYRLSNSVSQLIADSIIGGGHMPMINSCYIYESADTIAIRFNYEDDNHSAWNHYMIQNNTRYLQVESNLIPIFVPTDILFVSDTGFDKSKDVSWDKNRMNYAILVFIYHGPIIRYENLYKKVARKMR